MSEPFEIKRLEYSEKIRFGSRPGVSFRKDGASYVNKKAASLMELKHADCIALYLLQDRWFIGNDPECGATANFSDGMYKFCDTNGVKKLFEFFGLTGKKASFFLGQELEPFTNTKALLINPHPFNIE